MAIATRLFRSAGAARNTRSICTSSFRGQRITPSSLLPRQQPPTALRASSCRTPHLSSSSPFFLSVRQQSTRPPNPLTDNDGNQQQSAEDEAREQARRDQEPAYLITFTCKPCQHRSSHRITKHGYHKGTVLIACPNCNNRHLMSDHLKIFSDQAITLEDILAQKDQKLTKGTMRGNPEGDMEWWGDDESAGQSSESTSEAGDSSAEKSEKPQ